MKNKTFLYQIQKQMTKTITFSFLDFYLSSKNRKDQSYTDTYIILETSPYHDAYATVLYRVHRGFAETLWTIVEHIHQSTKCCPVSL